MHSPSPMAGEGLGGFGAACKLGRGASPPVSLFFVFWYFPSLSPAGHKADAPITWPCEAFTSEQGKPTVCPWGQRGVGLLGAGVGDAQGDPVSRSHVSQAGARAAAVSREYLPSPQRAELLPSLWWQERAFCFPSRGARTFIVCLFIS